MAAIEFEGVIVDYGNGVRGYLVGCTAEQATRYLNVGQAVDGHRRWLTSPEKLRLLVYGR